MNMSGSSYTSDDINTSREDSVSQVDLTSILYSAVSSQLYGNQPDLTPSSLMDDLKRLSKRNQQRSPSFIQTVSPPIPGYSDAMSTEQLSASLSTSRARRSSVSDRQLLFAAKSPVLQYHLNDQLLDVNLLPTAAPTPISTPSASHNTIEETHDCMVQHPHEISNQMVPSTLSIPQTRVISASTDPVIIDRATAAAINLQNRTETDEDEVSISSDETNGTDQESAVSSVKNERDNSSMSPVPFVSSKLSELIPPLPHLVSTESLSQKKSKTPADAWKKFSTNIRKVNLRSSDREVFLVVLILTLHSLLWFDSLLYRWDS